MATFLVKTEAGDYSFDDLMKDKETIWSGVSNPVALKNVRSIRKGDDVLVYHTGDEKAIVGLAKAASGPYEDPKRPGLTEDGRPKFAVFDLKGVRPVKTPVTLAAIKADQRFKEFALVRQGRLSVMPVPEALDRILRGMAGL
jgi:predicted RNA-binding protein with PUA-like domain